MLESRVKSVRVAALFLEIKPEEIGDRDVLAKTLGVDSVAHFQVLVAIEEAFDLKFAEQAFDLARCRTVRDIAQLVREAGDA